MTEKRFTFNDLKVLSDETILNNLRVLSAESVLNILNQLVDENEHLKKQYNNLFDELDSLAEVNDRFYKENEQLKTELKRIYDVATANKVKNIVEEIYDDLLYETSEESEFKRTIVLKCLEKIDNFRDDMND